MHTLRTIFAALAITGMLTACGGNDNDWTQSQRNKLNETVFSIPDVTADQAQCLIDYIISHWTAAEVTDGAGHEEAHGHEAGLACR